MKRGDATALSLLGAGDGATLGVKGEVHPARVRLGESVVVTAVVENRGEAAAHVVAEARVHFARPTGRDAVKTFRLGRRDVAPGARVEVARALAMVHRTIRQLHGGAHRVEVQVNGRVVPAGAFALVVPHAPRRRKTPAPK